MSPRARPGAPQLTLRAWPFGAPARRRLLEVLLLTSAPRDGWTKSGLERACDVSAGTLDDQLAAAVALGLVELRAGRFFRPKPLPGLARSLRATLRQTATVAEARVAPLPRRAYRRADPPD